MTDSCKPHKSTRSLVGIIVTFTVAGACAGFAGGQLSTRAQATRDVATIKASYDEASKTRGEALRMCLMLAPKAADSAAAAAASAQQAADKAAAAATGEKP